MHVTQLLDRARAEILCCEVCLGRCEILLHLYRLQSNGVVGDSKETLGKEQDWTGTSVGSELGKLHMTSAERGGVAEHV